MKKEVRLNTGKEIETGLLIFRWDKRAVPADNNITFRNKIPGQSRGNRPAHTGNNSFHRAPPFENKELHKNSEKNYEL
jgi:hypothetical protein